MEQLQRHLHRIFYNATDLFFSALRRAVEFAPGKWNEMHVIALGLENGEVYTAQLRFEPVCL
jgi:hypothetical protein